MSRFRVSGLLLSTLLVLPVVAAAADQQRDESGSPGAEGESGQTPFWSFAWVSDLHLDASRLQSMARAFHYIDAELKPHFVLLTGDNNAHADPPADPDHPAPLGVRRQRFLKAFLEQHLKRPYVLVTADNWTEGFDTVFGPHQSSFDCGGLHFLLLDPDRVHHGSGFEGLSVFDETTWEWICRDLDRNRDRPTIVALHEPVHPPTFLDAPRLRELLDRHSQVVAVLQGHLHRDWEFHRRGTTYLVAPSLGSPRSPAMKLVHVYPEGLVVRTISDSQANGCFEMTSRRQRIEIPPSLRSRLGQPSSPDFVPAQYRSVPAHPIVDDPALAARAGELLKNSVQMLWPWTSPAAQPRSPDDLPGP